MLAPFIQLCADSWPVSLDLQFVSALHSTSHLRAAMRASVAVLLPTLLLVAPKSRPVWSGFLLLRHVVLVQSLSFQLKECPGPLICLLSVLPFLARALSSRWVPLRIPLEVPGCCVPSTINLRQRVPVAKLQRLPGGTHDCANAMARSVSLQRSRRSSRAR